MQRCDEARSVLSVVLLMAIFVVPILGQVPFATRGEAREALVAQAMVSTGDFVLPRGYSGVVPSKPPLLHWGIAGVAKLTGQPVDEFNARLPSALAGLAFLAAFGVLVCRHTGLSVSLWTVVILGFSFEWLRALVSCRVDMIFSAAFTGGLLAFWRWQERGARGTPWSMIVLLAAATLAKGPVALVLCGAIGSVYALLRGERQLRFFLRFGGLLAVAGGAAASWYLLAYLRGGDEFLGKFLYENVARFTSTMEDRPHAHSVGYLFGMLLLGFMPFTLLWGRALGAEVFSRLAAVWKDRRTAGWRTGSLRSLVERLRGWGMSEDPLVVFCVCVSVGIFLFFSIPEGKRSVYLLPSYPALAFLLARWAMRQPPLSKQWGRVGGILGFGVAACITTIVLVPPPLWGPLVPVSIAPLSGEIIAALRERGVLLGGSIGFLLVASFRAYGRINQESAGRELTVLFGSIIFATLACIQPSVTAPIAARRLANDVAAIVPTDAKLYSFGTEFYGLSFALGQPITSLAADGMVAPVPGDYIVILEKNEKALLARMKDRKVRSIWRSSYGVQSFKDTGEIFLVESR